MLDFVCQDFNNCAISTGEWGCYSNCFLLLYIYTYDMKISTAINLGEWLLDALCVCNEWTIAISRASRIQWPFQEPKLEVPAIYKAYVLGLCKGISPEKYGLIWCSTSILGSWNSQWRMVIRNHVFFRSKLFRWEITHSRGICQYRWGYQYLIIWVCLKVGNIQKIAILKGNMIIIMILSLTIIAISES